MEDTNLSLLYEAFTVKWQQADHMQQQLQGIKGQRSKAGDELNKCHHWLKEFKK